MTLKLKTHDLTESTPASQPPPAPCTSAPPQFPSYRNTVHRNPCGQITHVSVRILSTALCEDRITAAQQFFDQNYRFWFHDRAGLAEALQPMINENPAIAGDRAQGLLIAAEMRRLQEISARNHQQAWEQYTKAAMSRRDGEFTRPGRRTYLDQEYRREPTKSFYQNSVNSVVASNKHMATMCVAYDLYQFMFVCGADDDNGSRYQNYDWKKLADLVEALMGVIFEGGEGYNNEYAYGRWDWETGVRRFMSSFGLDWEAALRYEHFYRK